MAAPVIFQDDFSAGMVRNTARHLIPRNGAYSIVDGLLDDDGSIYRRGGSVRKSSSTFANPLRFLWDGFMDTNVGLRTLVAHSSAFGILSPSDDASVVAIGGAGLTEPKQTAFVGSLLWIGGGQIYGGSQKSATYSTGTVTTTLNSTALAGVGTSWLANVDAGMVLAISGDTLRFYVVASVTNDTNLVLTEPYLGTAAAGQTYTGKAIEQAGALTSIGSVRGLATSEFYAAVGGRLVLASANRLYMSKPIDPATGRQRPQEFSATDYHDMPDGVRITGLQAIRDRLLVFTTAGVWMISNIALAIVDPSGNPQHRKEQISTDHVLWGGPGITTWRNAVIAPCADSVYVLDGISAPLEIGQSLGPLYLAYVRAGYKPGQSTVYNNHLFLPVIDAGNVVVDMLVCRLDRPTKHRGQEIFPWTAMRGHAGQVAALANRAASGVQRNPKLLAAGVDKYVLDLSYVFEPAIAVKSDADATAHQLILETRDYRTSARGARNQNTVQRMRARYVLVDAAADNPTIVAYYSVGVLQGNLTLWDAFLWGTGTWVDTSLAEYVQLTGGAPEDDGRKPYAWSGWAAKTQFVRFQLRSSGAAASCAVREVEAFVRESANVW